VIPPANLRAHLDASNVNMVTGGGQATNPMVYAVERVLREKSGVNSIEFGPRQAQQM
jgi:acetaldehyde dehydrogenase